ncbi:hypothetical protein M2103_000651 [Ereboglobus sp. PH5-5]|uniref:hypothetical protein n=1 Tax=unclassified Ereboglobus TaxID=2626932 RepID=UPI0024058A92|nr:MULTISPECIES: hypothetical protein [unclassified Ereboglobus]MDF9828192.1 hypothetical protein [Ereboglobus sp. PH5-10]MDF9832441.1 hypothetical protein [Ereboglobus sp. PH5-5]
MANGVPIISGPRPRAIAGGHAVRGVRVRANALVLALALAMPVIVHMAPWGGGAPLGAFLLPMFWAAFVAVYLYGIWPGLLVAAFGPVANNFLTNFPELRINTVLTFEVAVFVVFSWLVLRNPRGRAFWLLAPLAYVAAKVCSCALIAAGVDIFGNLGAATEFFARSVSRGAPGLVVLAAINFALARGWIGGNGGGGHGPEAAA